MVIDITLDEQLNQVLNVKPKNRITIGYCRVSNHKQKDDLERQIDNVKEYLLAKGQPAKKLIRDLIQEDTDGTSHKSNADTKQCTEN